MQLTSDRRAAAFLPVDRPRLCRCLLLPCLLGSLAAATEPARLPVPAVGQDPRRVYDRDAPAWLRAVGKMQVPGIRYRDGRRTHNVEDCSATLVASPTASRADIIVTAWHCLEHYDDLSKRITFTLLPGSDASVSTEAVMLANGGGMHADWAILRLRKPVPQAQVKALNPAPQRADPGRKITMAGYSRDGGRGEFGARLTYDPACNITDQRRDSSDSDCAAHKGASGGAVVQLSAAGLPRFAGVISQGNGAGFSRFVPVQVFYPAIAAYLD